MTKQKAKIGVTMGDPSGIGPETVARMLNDDVLPEDVEPIVFGDPLVMKRAFCLIGRENHMPEEITIVRVSEMPEEPQNISPQRCGEASLAYLDRAIQFAVQGEVSAIVTAPVNKSHWQAAGCPFKGHTDYIAHMTGTEKYTMMFVLPAKPLLFMSLVTIHETIKDVPGLLNIERVLDSIALTNDHIKRHFGIERPRIAVCGLNPHAGEDGMLGSEEQAIIRPAILTALNKSINVQGPYPADTIFARALKGEFDAVISMYHDQGITPFKTLDFIGTVNITIGIPFIRVSAGHGTADDIAWRGKASCKGIKTAVETAAIMIKNASKDGGRCYDTY